MSRIILKLSGEALAGPKRMGFDEETVRGVAAQVRQLVDAGYEIGVVTARIPSFSTTSIRSTSDTALWV